VSDATPEDPAPHHWAERYAEVKRERDEAVDAAARLRALALAVEEAMHSTGAAGVRQILADALAAAVGSVDPEGETPISDGLQQAREAAQRLPDALRHAVRISGTKDTVRPARPSVCPTCGSDDSESMEQPCADRHWGISPSQKAPDSWHSPDRKK
jgi:hypothetical protein